MSYSAAGLDPTCLHKHKCGSRTERVNREFSILADTAVAFRGWESSRELSLLGRVVLHKIAWVFFFVKRLTEVGQMNCHRFWLIGRELCRER